MLQTDANIENKMDGGNDQKIKSNGSDKVSRLENGNGDGSHASLTQGQHINLSIYNKAKENDLIAHLLIDEASFSKMNEIEQVIYLSDVGNGRQPDSANGAMPEVVTSVGEQNTDPWQAQTLTLQDAFAPRPPIKHIVKGFIATGSLWMFFGMPGTMKSMIAADLALCVASEQEWLTSSDGSLGLPTHKTKVLWVDCDNGKRRTDSRFEAIATAHGIPKDSDSFFYVSMPTPFPNLALEGGNGPLASRIKSLNAGLVILDNLGVVIGGIDENSNGMASINLWC